MAQSMSDYVITEAGFGADLGAEKFIHVKGKHPDAIVIVATVRALKYNGGADVASLTEQNHKALDAGIPNLERHIQNMKQFGVPVIVAINSFADDTFSEILTIKKACAKYDVKAIEVESFSHGQYGAIDLARHIIMECNKSNTFNDYYPLGVVKKINHIASNIYRATTVNLSSNAAKSLALLYENFDNDWLNSLPVCIAKNPYSFTGDQNILGAPTGFSIEIRDLKLRAGAGFLVAYAGDVLTMPGLPKIPLVEKYQ